MVLVGAMVNAARSSDRPSSPAGAARSIAAHRRFLDHRQARMATSGCVLDSAWKT
jgi:hypothetical protein